MNIHITKTYNIGRETGMRQNSVRNVAAKLGCKEMSLFKFPDKYDPDEGLHVRMDGIISSLCNGDIVLFQYPSGVSGRYDRFLTEHLRRYAGIRIVMFVQEIASLSEESGYTLEDELAVLGQADYFIMPSEEIYAYYRSRGLSDKPVMMHKFYDYMTDIMIREHKERRIYILSKEIEPGNSVSESNIEMYPFDEYHVPETILKFAEGGLGLIWNFDGEEGVLSGSYGLSLGIFMAAGIPVIVQKGLPCEEYILKQGVGFAAESMEEVYKICAGISDEDFDAYYDRVRRIQYLFTSGAYTKRLLAEMLIRVTEK